MPTFCLPRVLPLAKAVLFLLLLAACGVPGPPVPPTAKIPVPPTDLSARQVGEQVLLRWRVEPAYTDGSRMEGWPRLVVLRLFAENAAPPALPAFKEQARVAYEIPAQVADTFLQDGLLVFPDVLEPDVLARHAGRPVVYAVQAVGEQGKAAGLSNLASVRLYPVPRRIGRIQVEVTEEAIVLRWSPPERTTSGTPLALIGGYRVYRSRTGKSGSFELQGTAPTALYRDPDFRFGQKYFYRVRTQAQFGSDTVESADSVTVEVAPRDLFPPPVPANLIAVAGPERVDLTWDASPVDDLAGYLVYRRRAPEDDYERLNREPLPAQSYADTGLEAGAPYRYAVTAVDEEGNESRFSEEVAVTPRATD